MKTKLTILNLLLLFAASSTWAQQITGPLFRLASPKATIMLKLEWTTYFANEIVSVNGVNLKSGEFKEIPMSSNHMADVSVIYTPPLQPIPILITGFECSGNELTDFIIWPSSILSTANMKYLNLNANNLTNLDLKLAYYLEELDCYRNDLTTMDLRGLSALKSVKCFENQLTTLNLKGCTNLENLDCRVNELIELDLNGLTALRSLVCGNNQLASLNLNGFTALEELRCNQNQLTSLNINGCTNLTNFQAYLQSVSVQLSGSNYKNPMEFIGPNGLSMAVTIDQALYAKGDNLPTNLGSTLPFSFDFPAGITHGDPFDGNITLSGYTPPPPTIPVTGLSIIPPTLPLAVGGGTGTVSVSVTPPNATNKNVTWSSNNEFVAFISSTGVVTPISAGTVIITATSVDNNTITDTYTLTIAAASPSTIAVTGVAIVPQTLSLTVGGNNGALTANITPADATNKNVTWSSSDESIAIVSSSGTVAPLSAGSVTIKATSVDGSNISGSCVVTVAPAVGNDNVSSASFSTFPNPTSGTVTITGLTAGKTIKIYSITGALVGTYTAQGEEMTLNLDNLSKGFYFLNFEGETIRIMKN